MNIRHVPTIRLSCISLVSAAIALLGMGIGARSAGASSPRATARTAPNFNDPRCLTLAQGNAGACPPGSPTISAVSVDGSLATTPSGTVYKNGGVLSTGLTPAAPIVGVVANPVSPGQYWLVGRDGGVFALGGAPFYGSMGGKLLNAPIVGIVTTPDGDGYWLVASDGGVFAFGAAAFLGSLGRLPLNAPIVGMALGGNAVGYYLAAADGGVFAFGNAPFYGSMGGQPLHGAVVGIASTGNVFSTTGTVVGSGYFLAGSDGGIFAFGNSQFSGSFVGVSAAPVIGMFTIDGDCDPFGPTDPVPNVVTSDGSTYGQMQTVC